MFGRTVDLCCGCISRRIGHPSDTPEDAARKRRSFFVGSIGLIFSAIGWFSIGYDSVYNYVSWALLLSPSVTLVVYIGATRSAPDALLEGVSYAFLMCFLLMIYTSSMHGIGHGKSSAIILLLDMALLNKLSARVAVVSIATLGVWLLIVEVLQAARATLPDTVRIEHMCEACYNPPCRLATDLSVALTMQDFLILLVDFHLTRGFAVQVWSEQAAMRASVVAAERVASCLASFDLDAADALLQEDGEGALPPELASALHRVMQNLRAYKPYLPRSCLPLDSIAPPESDSSSGGSLGSSRSRSASSGPAEPGCVTATFRAELAAKRCTLAVTNFHGTLHMLRNDPEGFATGFSLLLARAMRCVEASRGIVDIFLGDRVFSSFNASRQCVQHGAYAVQALRVLHRGFEGPAPFNTGVATGRAHCGDLGCSEMRRFTALGRVALLACGVERAGRALGVALACNKVAYFDASVHHPIRQYPRLVTLLRTAGAQGGDGGEGIEGDAHSSGGGAPTSRHTEVARLHHHRPWSATAGGGGGASPPASPVFGFGERLCVDGGGGVGQGVLCSHMPIFEVLLEEGGGRRRCSGAEARRV